MNKKKRITKEISKRFPCRENDLGTLYNYFSTKTMYPAFYIHGLNGTGKTAILGELFKYLDHVHTVFINCLNCYTPQLLFESVIDGLCDHQLSEASNYASYAKCKIASEFVSALNTLPLDTNGQCQVIVFDRAEKLRDMDANIFPLFLKLSEITKFEVSCVFVSFLPFHKMIPSSGSFSEPILHYWPQYSQQDLLIILCTKHVHFKGILYERICEAGLSGTEQKRQLDLVDEQVTETFLENYINICLQTFFQACRDFVELYDACKDCFSSYCEPILNGTIDASDSARLYANISETLKVALNLEYKDLSESLQNLDISKRRKQLDVSEYSYFGKYMLIAAVLATYIDTNADKRIFLKTKNVQQKKKQKEKVSINIPPKPFTIDRLLAIFYAIVDEEPKYYDKVMELIPNFVQRKLFIYVTDASLMGEAKLLCALLDNEVIIEMADSLNFDICKYLNSV